MKTKNRTFQSLERKDSRIRRFTFYILHAVFTVLLGPALYAQSISLDSVLSVIEKQNPMLQAYRNRSQAMHAYVAGSKSIMAPEVGGGLWMFPYGKQDYDNVQDTRQIMVSVSQTFTNPAKLKANHQYMSSRSRIEQTAARIAFNELRAQARLAYYRWYVYEQKKTVLTEGEEILGLMLEINQLRYPLNQGKLASIYKTEARLHEVKNMQLMNDNEIFRQKTELGRLMNEQSEFTYKLNPASISVDQLFTEVDTTALVASRSDLLLVDQSIESIQLSQAVERTQSKPDFNISFNHMISVGQGMPDQFMLLGMVTIPIAPWSSKMYKANQQGMVQEIESMKSERQAILNEAQGMIRSMVSEIKTLKQQLDNYEKRILPALKRNYDVLMLAYQENREELPMVVEGWETWNMTQLQYFDTMNKYYEMITKYEKEIEK